VLCADRCEVCLKPVSIQIMADNSEPWERFDLNTNFTKVASGKIKSRLPKLRCRLSWGSMHGCEFHRKCSI